MGMEPKTEPEKRTWSGGVKLAAPIVLGYIPVGFAYGVLAREAGISSVNTVLMSLLVFAGSAQFIAAGLIGAGASPFSVILTTFVVNLRHLLMAAALVPFLRQWRRRELSLFGFQLTDETFALHSSRLYAVDPDKSEMFATNMTAQTSWVLGTMLGVSASTLITDVRPIGLDFALPAMFIALLVVQFKSRTHVLVAVAAGCVSVFLQHAGMEQFHVIAATVAAATLGVVLQSWTRS